MEGVIARRYAKAFLGLSQDPAQTAEELSALADVYETNLEFRAFMAEPKVDQASKAKTVGNICGEFSEQTQKFVRYLTHKNRFQLIGFVALAFEKMALAKLGKGKANITTAFKMTDAETKDLAKKLSDYTKLDVALEVEVDQSILGGAVTQIGSLVLDGSVKNRLNLIKETIARGN